MLLLILVMWCLWKRDALRDCCFHWQRKKYFVKEYVKKFFGIVLFENFCCTTVRKC